MTLTKLVEEYGNVISNWSMTPPEVRLKALSAVTACAKTLGTNQSEVWTAVKHMHEAKTMENVQ